jgi:hypothetical protein
MADNHSFDPSDPIEICNDSLADRSPNRAKDRDTTGGDIERPAVVLSPI